MGCPSMQRLQQDQRVGLYFLLRPYNSFSHWRSGSINPCLDKRVMYAVEINHEGTWVSVEGQFLTLYDVVGYCSDASNFAPVFFCEEYRVLDENGEVVPPEILTQYK
jgi:hypothetical protein